MSVKDKNLSWAISFKVNMHRGYIKIWRRSMDSFTFLDSETFHLWITLLMLAGYEEKEMLFNGKKLLLKRGQFISGRKSLSEKTGISESKIYRLLDIFEREQLIEQQKTNLYSIISILNYDDYQSNEQQNEQPVNNQRTTSEQPVNTTNTSKRTKNTLKRINTFDFESLWSKYPRRIKSKDALRHFNASVKTEQDFLDINRALDNYIASEEVKKGIIQYGSTWFNNWRDWLDVESATGKSQNMLEMERIIHEH